MPSDQRTGRSSLPDQRTLLSWVFVGRLILAVGVLMGAGLVWTERPQESFLVSVSVVIALTFTAYGAWVVHLQRREAGNGFLLVQAIVDLGVVTTVVHFAGQPQSAFPSLYVLVVAAYAPFLTFHALLLHANVGWTFGPLRYVVSSPAFHRWHHTTEAEGLDKNFAGLFPFIDLAFGTFYMPPGRQPERFGIVNDDVPAGLFRQLAYPFRSFPGARP